MSIYDANKGSEEPLLTEREKGRTMAFGLTFGSYLIILVVFLAIAAAVVLWSTSPKGHLTDDRTGFIPVSNVMPS